MIAVADWHPADRMILEPNAWHASIEQKRCLALTAGPGAGKTEMLAQRADFLLRTGTCRYPKRILAISFKMDASYNLKERVRRRCSTDLSSRFDSHTFHAFAKIIIDRFRPVLKGDDALDSDYKIGKDKITHKQIRFKDIIRLAIQILRVSRIARNAIRQTYSDVFLDEFQDCTDQQYELVKIAFQDTSIRLTAVGDTKQKIMAWAGALDGIFEVFVKDFNALAYNMYRNFRSKPRLLRMQNEIIRVLDPQSVMPKEQLLGSEGEIHSCYFNSSRDEAECLANMISSWVVKEGIPLSEIAVLVSKQPDLYVNHLMAELKKNNIPFRNEQQLQDLSIEPVARLIIDYLVSLSGDREPIAWIRLMNVLTTIIDDDGQADGIQHWLCFIKNERKKAVELNLHHDGSANYWFFVQRLLEKIGLNVLAALSPDYESHVWLQEIIKETKNRIEELLKIELYLPLALARFSDNQAIRILTIHKSKGLEFDSVIIQGVENETFWGKIEEERCAFFVGISRAKRRLVMTVCGERDVPPSCSGRWCKVRTPHDEFLRYAESVHGFQIR